MSPFGEPELTPVQRERVEATLRFARTRLAPGARRRDQEGVFDRELWDQAARFGLAGLPIPEAWGGGGLDALDTMLIIEALGRAADDGGLIFSLCAHMFASAVPMWRAGDARMHERYLRAVASGRLICANGTTEAEAGSDVHAMRATARRDGDAYVLDGTKCFITNAPVADLFLVYAKTNPQAGFLGISAFVVPRDTPGLQVVAEHGKSGLRSAPWGTIYLESCRVPAGSRLGPEGAGAALFRESMIWERCCLFAYYVGAMATQLDRCIEHVRTRKQFGRALGNNQAVAHRIVDMRLRLETSRLLLYRAGDLHRRGLPCADEIAMCKLWISESAVQSGLDAIQLFGAYGVVADGGVDALLRDALPARVFSGTSEVQRVLLARAMGVS